MPVTRTNNVDPIPSSEESLEKAKSLGYIYLPKKFSFNKTDWQYHLFVGDKGPDVSFGVEGDICYITDNLQEGLKYLKKKTSTHLVAPGQIYVRESQAWVLVKPDFDGDNYTPMTKHPQLSKMCLNYDSLVWSPTSYYSNNKTKERRNRIMLSSPTTLIPPSFTPPCKTTSNAWLLKEYSLWTSPPISLITPVQDQGRRILAKLLQSDKELPMNPGSIHIFTNIPHPSIFDIPRMDDCIADLLALPDSKIQAVNFGTSANRSGISTIDIIASLLMASTNYKRWEVSDPLLGILNLPASPKGLGRFQLKIPDYPNEPKQKWTFKMNPEIPSQYEWHSSINPAGAITSPHTDFAGSGQHIVHIFGRKLWFLWPPTPDNLAKLNGPHLNESASELTIEAALDQLQGLELFLIEDPMVQWFLPANHIHAVMTLCTSCHTAVKVWGTSQFEATREMVDQVVKILHHSKPGQLPDDAIKYFTEFLQEFAKEDIPEWKRLGKLKSPGRKAILDWIKEVEKTLEDLPIEIYD